MTAAERLAAALHIAGQKLEGAYGAEAILGADPALADAIELGEAWRAAEAAVDETGRSFLRLTRHNATYFYAACNWIPGELGEDAAADTPAAALRALAEKLR